MAESCCCEQSMSVCLWRKKKTNELIVSDFNSWHPRRRRRVSQLKRKRENLYQTFVPRTSLYLAWLHGNVELFMISNGRAREWVETFHPFHFCWISNSHHLLHCTTWHWHHQQSTRERVSSSFEEGKKCEYFFYIHNLTQTHTELCVCTRLEEKSEAADSAKEEPNPSNNSSINSN